MSKQNVQTAMLTPLQVRDAIIAWARLNGLVGTYEDLDWRTVTIRANGSAVIKRTKVQP